MKLFTESEYPDELHIGEETYKVKFVKRIPECSSSDIGMADSGEKIIYIKKGLTKQQLFRTFIHEVLHAAAEYENDIKLSHKTVYQLEKVISDFILMNY